MPQTSRPYRTPDDLRAMQILARRLWSTGSQHHIGDLAWGRNQHVCREPDWPTRLWEADGQVLAWGWIELPDQLTLQVDPARPDLADEVLGWFAATVPGGGEVVVLEQEGHLVAALERHGYVRDDGVPYSLHMVRGLDALPEPAPPPGFTLRPVDGPAEAARRAEVHRAAWAPSRVTEASYRNVMAAWPYRPSLDWVAEAPDGSFAASCLIWLDDQHRVGEIEPVGTAPRFRRRGLARAVCLAALHALRSEGGEHAIVYPVLGHPRAEGAHPLYAGLGFAPYARTQTYTR